MFFLGEQTHLIGSVPGKFRKVQADWLHFCFASFQSGNREEAFDDLRQAMGLLQGASDCVSTILILLSKQGRALLLRSALKLIVRRGNAAISSWMNKLSSFGKGAVMFWAYRDGAVALLRRARITLNRF